MAITKVLACDLCKQPINDIKLDAIAVLGNIHTTDCHENNGFGGGYSEFEKKLDEAFENKLYEEG